MSVERFFALVLLPPPQLVACNTSSSLMNEGPAAEAEVLAVSALRFFFLVVVLLAVVRDRIASALGPDIYFAARYAFNDGSGICRSIGIRILVMGRGRRYHWACCARLFKLYLCDSRTTWSKPPGMSHSKHIDYVILDAKLGTRWDLKGGSLSAWN